MLLHEWSYLTFERPKTILNNNKLEKDRKEPIENLTTWVYEEDSYVPTAKITEKGVYSIISDYLGRPVQAFDKDDKLVWHAEYNIYGKINMLIGNKRSIPFRQLGQYEDSETELYYNRYRYYDYNTGAYISKDPIGLLGNNPNLYAYVKDSNNWVDVFGLDSFGPNQDVYALYNKADVVNGVPVEGSKPYYVGISQNSDVRLKEHTGTGKFNPETDVKVDLHKDIDYAKARAYEQKYIEDFKTVDTSNPKANHQNSFRHSRTDTRGKAFEAEYNKIKYN